jgi:hypothetical protein
MQAPREEMIDALRVLELLHIINKQERHAQPAAEFYNLEVSYTLDLHREYMTWRQWVTPPLPPHTHLLLL